MENHEWDIQGRIQMTVLPIGDSHHEPVNAKKL
jgi:hypothetical protein